MPQPQNDTKTDDLVLLRLDVDYPYPSRNKSLILAFLGITVKSGYVKNAKIIAKMINESDQNIKAYWFFTPKTIPDKQLRELLDNSKHEIGLHIAKKAQKELKKLEAITGKKIRYYTIHGTQRLLGQIIWKRKPGQTRASVPSDFPLKSFYEFPNDGHPVNSIGLDWCCNVMSPKDVDEIVARAVKTGEILHVHPEWLFNRGKLNHRGPFYPTLKKILQVDGDLDNLSIQKKGLIKIASFTTEYLKDSVFNEAFLGKLKDRNVDVYSFLERSWCNPIPNPPTTWIKNSDNIALLEISSYEQWWAQIGKKTRNMVRKAEKSGVQVKIVEPSKELALGIWKIYNETPIRQGRAFSHYGVSLENVEAQVMSAQDGIFIGAYLDEELLGFIQLEFGDNIGIVAQILSLQKHWDKALNNAVLAKAVEVATQKKAHWLMYGRIGNHPSLDIFKQNNGFVQYPLNRYVIPLSRKGKLAVTLGLHKPLKDALPSVIKKPLFPVFNWVSRTKIKLKR
ncbi:MAG: hypothetical protein NWF01_05860 [Candidatus Bathyarchaeota archaeon]|nr:hypothetical protein [Candidatus Bathyarchaeota archaeon]